MRTISSVSTGRTRRFTTRACTTRLLPKLRNILILLYQVDYIIVGSISAFQRFSTLRPSGFACQHGAFGGLSARSGWRLRFQLVSRVARFVAPQRSTELLSSRLAKRERARAERLIS